MKVSTKKRDGNKLVIEAVATPTEVNNALDAASQAFARSMGLFPVPGKSIAQVAAENMGIRNLDAVVQGTAMEVLVPFALDKRNVIPAYLPKAQPKGPLVRNQEFAFTIEAEEKLTYDLSSYDPVEITAKHFSFDESAVDEQIALLAQNSSRLIPADPKPIEMGDTALIAMKCTRNGEEMKNLTTEGRAYKTGAGYMPEGFDKGVLGMEPGQTKTFTFEAPSFDANNNPITETIEATVTVKEIQKEEIPTIDDEWVAKNMPIYKDLAGLRKDIHDTLESQARRQYDDEMLGMVASELGRRFEGSISDAIYEAMRDSLVANIRMDLQNRGQNLEQFMKQSGGEQQFNMMVMVQARMLLVQGYALDALYIHEGLEINDNDILAACHAMNPQVDPKELRQQMMDNGRYFALRETAMRMKANLFALEHAKITYED